MIMDDLIYLVCLVLATKIALRLTDLAIGEYRILLEQQGKQDDQISEDQLDPLITALHRLSGLLVVVIALSIGLAHFGLNVSSLLIALVLFGFILSFGAKDIVTDAISGLILLVDQPFRPGDAILIKDLDTWGDVVEIGTRSTRLRTADRRMVAVPNSRIVQSEVVNYTSPDPLFRAKTEVRIAYNTDMETVRQIITAAVRNVEGVLADRPVDVLFIGFGDSTRSVDVRWWIEGVHMRQHMLDQVNSALESALAQAHIYMPYTTYALQVKFEDEEVVEKPADHGLSAAH